MVHTNRITYMVDEGGSISPLKHWRSLIKYWQNKMSQTQPDLHTVGMLTKYHRSFFPCVRCSLVYSRGLDYRCGCIIAVLYPWYYTTILYNTLNCAMYYTTPSELWTLYEDHYYGAIKGRLSALHKNPTRASQVSAITRWPNAFIVAHELSWASTRSRPGPPLCSIQNNSIVESLQLGIQTYASGCSNCALIADMNFNLKRTPSTRMRMVVLVALMKLIALTYPSASTTCMTRISLRPRRWWTRVTSMNEVVWVLYNTFGIIQYYMVLYSAIRKDSNYTNP